VWQRKERAEKASEGPSLRPLLPGSTCADEHVCVLTSSSGRRRHVYVVEACLRGGGMSTWRRHVYVVEACLRGLYSGMYLTGGAEGGGASVLIWLGSICRICANRHVVLVAPLGTSCTEAGDRGVRCGRGWQHPQGKLPRASHATVGRSHTVIVKVTGGMACIGESCLGTFLVLCVSEPRPWSAGRSEHSFARFERAICHGRWCRPVAMWCRACTGRS